MRLPEFFAEIFIENRNFKSVSSSRRVVEALLFSIAMLLLWFIIRILDTIYPGIFGTYQGLFLGFMSFILLLVPLFQIEWIYLLHKDLKNYFSSYPIAPIAAACLWLYGVEVIGVGVIFLTLIYQFNKRTKNRHNQRSVLLWLAFHYVCVAIYPLINHHHSIYVSLALKDEFIWVLYQMSDQLIYILLILSVNKALQKL